MVAALAFWVALVIPTRLLWGDTNAVYCTVALAICLVPALLTLAWSVWAQAGPPEQQLVAVLGGTGIRLVVVSVLALMLYQRVDYFRQEPGFMVWVLVHYLFTLALEMAWLLAGRPATTLPDGSGMKG
jgi:hypothetical protein